MGFAAGLFPQVQRRTAPACLDGYGTEGWHIGVVALWGRIKPVTPGKVLALDLRGKAGTAPYFLLFINQINLLI